MQKDLQHWIPLLNHFDAYLSKQLLLRQDPSNDSLAEYFSGAAFPQRNILAVLNTTCLILKYCVNKQMYASLEVRLSTCRAAAAPCAVLERHPTPFTSFSPTASS